MTTNTNPIQTVINDCEIIQIVGKASTHVTHVTTNGRHANCGYNGMGRDLTEFNVLQPGDTHTARLCGKCFKHWTRISE